MSEQRELNYPGLVDAPVGDVMGPGINGTFWKVVGSMYDTVADKTTVTVEEVVK